MSPISKRIRDYDYVVALNYYHPHISGLSDMAKRVAEEVVTKGLTVCVDGVVFQTTHIAI